MSYPIYYVPSGDVLPIFFSSYDGGTGASITMTGLAITDVEIYRDGSITQRASDAGYTLLDTDGIDFDTITGIHGFSIDTGDNTDAGFYTVGAWFTVVVSAITIDAQTVNFIAAQFRLMAAESVAGKPKVDVDAWLGTAAATPTVAGVPEVDLTHVAGATTNVSALATNVDAVKTKTDFLPSVTAGGTGGLFIAGTNAATTITTGLTTTFTGNLTGSVGSVTGAVGSVTGAVGSVTGLTASNLDATISSRMATYTQPTGFLATTFPAGTVANTTNITAGTITTATNLTTNNDKTGYALSATGSAALTEGYAADGATGTLPQLLYMIQALLSEKSISGTTLTAKKLDGTTTAGTFTLNDATTPTSITRAT